MMASEKPTPDEPKSTFDNSSIFISTKKITRATTGIFTRIFPPNDGRTWNPNLKKKRGTVDNY